MKWNILLFHFRRKFDFRYQKEQHRQTLLNPSDKTSILQPPERNNPYSIKLVRIKVVNANAQDKIEYKKVIYQY